MRAYWILPNRDQQDDVLASDGKTIRPLRQIIDPRSRPDGFSHGVPTEILEKVGPGGLARILFAQRFPDWNGGKQLFSVLTTAGLDASGRVVHIGLLFVLEPHERPSFALPYSALSEQDKVYATGLLARLTSPGKGDPWAQSVHDLAELPSDAGPATNVALDRSVVAFDSLYVLRSGGLLKKAANRMKWTALILLIVLAILGLWFSVHAKTCSVALRPGNDSPQAAVLTVPNGLTGVMSWHFN
jgi:hypothetical protein